MTLERFERILQEHLLGGKPVTEWLVARNALGCGGETPTTGP
jgi:(2Fe-2S) ferredoxin